MMDLSTTYLGLPAAAPDHSRRVAARVGLRHRAPARGLRRGGHHLPSLFEEQIAAEEAGSAQFLRAHEESNAEALSYFPPADDYAMGPERYLEHVRRVSEAIEVPLIASLNGTTAAGWLSYARLMQDAGADALELNLYHVATDPSETGAAVEARLPRRRARGEADRSAFRSRSKLSPFLLVARQSGAPTGPPRGGRTGAVQPVLSAGD
jgi:dihydroorotate dehydrogenase (fumarate)